MKITRNAAKELYQTLSEIKGTYDKMFSMYLVLNMKKLRPVAEEIVEIDGILAPTEEVMDAQKRELDIVNKYVERDENDQPVLLGNNSFRIKNEHIDQYQQEITVLREEIKPITDERNKLVEKHKSMMEEEVDVEVMTIPFENLPSEIDVDVMDKLSDIIDYEKK